jgi:hypothetical protein
MFLVMKEDNFQDNLFLVDTYGYGPAWTKDKSEAWVFESEASANRVKRQLLIHAAEIAIAALV